MKKILSTIFFLLSLYCSVLAQTFNTAIIGDSYGRSDSALFYSDIKNFKSELFIRLWQRQSQFNFIPLSWKNSFSCSESTMWEGSSCRTTAVMKAILAFHLPVPIQVNAVMANKVRGGGGGSLCVMGTYWHNDTTSGEIDVHEFMHTAFGLQHNSIFMNSSCNHGACALNATFNTFEFDIINQRLNQVAGIFPSPQPTIQINDYRILYENGSGTGNTLVAYAQVTGLVQWVEVIFDGVSIGNLFYWDRNPYCNPNGIRYFKNPIPAGQHSLTMRAVDINNKKSEATISISVQ